VLVVRILTVLNDNISRWLVIGLGKRAATAAGATDAAVLAAGTVLYVLPFILFAWLAGWLADRFAKRSIVIWWKFAEIAIALVTATIVAWGAASRPLLAGLPLGLWLLFGAIGLFALQTTLLNPSLLGTIPETVPAGRLAAANGVFALVSLAATLAGMALGNWLADATPLLAAADPPVPLPPWLAGLPAGHSAPAAAVLVGVAVVGWVVSLSLPRIPAADPRAAFPRNAFAGTFRDIRRLLATPQLAGAALGIVWFWSIGAVVQLNVDQYAFESGATGQGQVVPLLLALVSGIGIGSVLAGRFSKRGIEAGSKVDLGFVPAGMLVMLVACGALALSAHDIFAGDSAAGLRLLAPIFWLTVLGIGAGMFDVPLEAYLQEQSPPEKRGAVLASTNLLVFTAMLIASIGYYGLRVPSGTGATAAPLLSARGIFGLFSALSLAVLAVAVWAAPRATLRFLVGGIVAAVWRFRTRQEENVPSAGPAVIVANHVSWLDGFLLPLAAPRPVRMVVYGPNIRGRFLTMLADQWRFILFDPKPKSIGRALKTIQAGLAAGDCVGIFCEGGISRNGQLLGFKRGLEWLLARVEAPIVPASIDGLWGSQLSFSEGRYFSKPIRRQRHGGPRRLRRTVALTFGQPLPVGTPPEEARLALQELSAEAVRRRLAGIRISGLPPEIDAAAAAAAAEAFDGCCLLRSRDRLVASLAAGDPLHDTLGLYGGALLGIDAAVLPADAPIDELVEVLGRRRASVWLARPEQVALAAACGGVRALATHLVVVVMPLAAPADLPAARAAASDLRQAAGIEAVTAYAPPEAGGLVAMNTPLARRGGDHEKTCAEDSLGRVVSGVVVWPSAAIRNRLGRPPFDLSAAAGERSLVVGATLPCAAGSGALAPRAALLGSDFVVDADGFLR